MKPVIHSIYDRPKPVQLRFFEPSLTEQHHKKDCDVNYIVERYKRTGVMPTNNRTPLYGDFTSTPQSYSEAVSLLRNAKDWFSGLPANIRNRFANDPEKILQFIEDPANRQECVKLGLLPELPTPPAMPEEIKPPKEAGAEHPEA